jgi:hypothetical protein
MHRLVLLAGLILLGLSSCQGNTAEPSSTPTIPPTIEPSPTPSAPAITPTATLVQVTVRVTTEAINCRFGPSTIYEKINELRQGQSTRAVGRNEASTWWYVRDPGNPNGLCWVSADVTETQGETDQLPIIPPPFVTVTNVSLRVEPSRIVVNCNQFPQTVFFEAQITTNGPTLFTWRWEVSNGAVSDIGTLIFEEASTQVINEYYQINAPNEYWVKLYALTPNERVEQITFPVTCTP